MAAGLCAVLREKRSRVGAAQVYASILHKKSSALVVDSCAKRLGFMLTSAISRRLVEQAKKYRILTGL